MHNTAPSTFKPITLYQTVVTSAYSTLQAHYQVNLVVGAKVKDGVSLRETLREVCVCIVCQSTMLGTASSCLLDSTTLRLVQLGNCPLHAIPKSLSPVIATIHRISKTHGLLLEHCCTSVCLHTPCNLLQF